jgi:hypothetical protein
VSLSRETQHGRRPRWTSLPEPVNLFASRGTNHDHLHAGYRLAPGIYRVTVIAGSSRAHYLALRVK